MMAFTPKKKGENPRISSLSAFLPASSVSDIFH